MRPQSLDLITLLLSSSLLIQPCLSHDTLLNSLSTTSGNASISTQFQTNDAANSTFSSTVPLATGIRPVYLVMNVRLTEAQTFPPTYNKLFPAYASLHFNATSTDGPLEIQLVNKDGQDLIRVTDWGLHNSDKPMGVPQSGYLTDYFELFGRSNVTNSQILNATTGRGLIHHVWGLNTSLALKAYNSIDFMHACIAELGLGLASSDNPSAIIPTRIALAQTYWRNLWVPEKIVPHYPVWLETLEGWGEQVRKSRAEFDWRDGADSSAGMVTSRPVPVDPATMNSTSSSVENGMSVLAAPEMMETYQANGDTLKTAPEYQWIYAQPSLQKHFQQRDQPPVPDQVLVYQPGDNDYPVIGQRLEDGGNEYALKSVTTPANDLVPPADRTGEAIDARIESKLIIKFARTVYGFSAISGIMAIVIVDFSKVDNSISLICAFVSLGVSVATVLLYFGPPGLAELLMLAAAIIGLIPDFGHSLMKSPPPPHGQSAARDNARWKRSNMAPTPPLKNDVQGILQYIIVGDRNQTGNEKCLSKGYKGCTVVYGPYLLAVALQMETFDAFALLIHYNEGYPMAMADLVKAFTLSTDPESVNQVAMIDCSHSSKPNDRFSWSNPNQATILKSCDKPIFSIKRYLIKIPLLNQPADRIYDRLMPEGNCTLVGDVSGGEKYAAYNITVRGGAVAIACGIVGAINVNGTGEPLPGVPPLSGSKLMSNSSNSHQIIPHSIVSPGNQSSDGSTGRAYLAPPRVAPFQKTLNLTNSICMSAPDGSKQYFPNGTYSRQRGSLGFDTTKANTLSLVVNSSLIITESSKARSKGVYAHAPAPPQTYVDHHVTYKTNQSATDINFADDMKNVIKYEQDNTFTVNVSAEPDAVCFYQQSFGKGDFACFGPGGGDLPAALKGKSKSIKAFGRASVEVFANNYGNSFARIFDTFEDDLGQIPYDKHSTFAEVATSIWVYLEPGLLIPTNAGT